MDLDEWELISDDGFIDYKEVGEKKIFSAICFSDSKSLINTNYFICPSPNSQQSRAPDKLVPAPIQLDSTILKTPYDESEKQIKEIPTEISVVPSSSAMEDEQDTISQVFFKKMNENEFVDMKMDSPKSGSKGIIIPQIEVGTFQFDEKAEVKDNNMSSPRMSMMSKKSSREMEFDGKEKVNWEETNGDGVRLNIVKWSLSGIGAICSFGIAAATICVIFLGNQQRNEQLKQNHKLRFQIYKDEKRMKRVVHLQQATKWNEAISAAKGVVFTTAQITSGGHYHSL